MRRRQPVVASFALRSSCRHRLYILSSLALLLLLSESWITVVVVVDAFSIPRSGDSRYFTVEMVAPPLERVSPSSSSSSSSLLEFQPEYCSSLHVVYTNDPHTVSQWLAVNVPPNGCTLGFDTESVPTGAPWIPHGSVNFLGPATVQLSTTKSSLVVQLARRNGKPCQACAPLLEAVLLDSSIVKAGCLVDEDLLALKQTRWNGLEAKSRFDLCGLRPNSHDPMPGLKRLTHCLLGLDLPKHKKLSASDWSQVPLTSKQVVYAARDSWAGAAISERLALLNENKFSTASLVQQLKTQPCLGEIGRRRENRKRAKALIASIRGRSRPETHGDSTTTTSRTEPSSWKTAIIRELRNVIQNNLAEKCILYHLPVLVNNNNQTSY